MRAIILLLFLFVMACVDPLNIKLPTPQTRLVVDGLITNQPGPYQVKLFYSKEFNSSEQNYFPVVQAQVSIFDDHQSKYNLTEISPGIYETNANELMGEIGKSYYLYVETKTGIQYQSSTQKITNPGEINNLYFEFLNDERPNFDDVLKVYVDSKGTLEDDNLFRWRWSTIYEAKSYPELYVVDVPGGGTRPAPLPCSGYIYRGQLIKIGECTCCICWSYNYSNGAIVSHNSYVSESQFNKQYLGSIPVTSMHFYDRYYIEVQQMSLSEEAYGFWSLIEKQQEGATDIFQPNAIKIRGNIKGVTNPDEEVLGFFGASGVTSKSLYIPKSVVPVELPPTGEYPFSCMEVFKNPTTEKPFFW
jgi:hypothetical protein